MTRAAIYARFSSDLQDHRSIDDQVEQCRIHADRQGWSVVQVYSDAAISGASIHGRNGFAQMVADSVEGKFDVVLAVDLDRFSRSIADMETFRAGMEFRGIAVHTIADGVVTKINAGLKGLMGSLFLDALKAHTRRGMAGVVREGRVAGALTYAYAPGEKVGTRTIVEHEAKIVRRIFEEYAGGRSPRDIARRLNDDEIPAPRGRDWQASSINGNRTRGSGILSNALYDGRIVWNRVSMRKVPGTNKRVSRRNPESEWIYTEVPALRIVPAELFAKVQALKAEHGKVRPEKSNRPRHLLAGLLRCGCCGSAMAVNNVTHAGRRIGCGRRKEGGRCPNGRTYKLAPIEHRVVEALKRQMRDPRGIERYLATYRAERKRLAAEESSRRGALEKTIAQASREIDRIVDAIARGTISDADARSRLDGPRQRRATAQAELTQLPAPLKVIALHPQAVAHYLATVDDLAAMLGRRMVDGGDEVAQSLRDLVAAVIVHPAGKDDPKIEIRGRLAQLTGESDLFPQQNIAAPIAAVAGARYIRSRWADGGCFAFPG